MKLYFIIGILIVGAAFSNAVMDTLQFHYQKSIFSGASYNQEFYNPKISWRNKWKNGDRQQGEKFPGSSTCFVLFTDAWHFAQFCMFTCFELIIVLLYYLWKRPRWYVPIAQFIALKILLGVSFELFFTKVLVLS